LVLIDYPPSKPSPIRNITHSTPLPPRNTVLASLYFVQNILFFLPVPHTAFGKTWFQVSLVGSAGNADVQ
jgi:hypothetical protein